VRCAQRRQDDADVLEFEMPSNLARQLEQEPAGSAPRGWAAELPSTVDQLARRWSLRLGRPYQPGGVTS